VGYVIRKLQAKTRSWKVQYQSRIGGPLKTRDVKETELLALGFKPEMSLEEARSIVASLNVREGNERLGRKKLAIRERLESETRALDAWFPKTDLTEFEGRELYRLIKPDTVAHQKRAIHWKAAKETIASVELEPSEWGQERARFYDYFLEREWSPSYVQKIVPLVNKWGSFYSRRRKLYFEPVPLPDGNDLEVLAEAYHERRAGLTQESKPLSPQALERARSKLEPGQYAWLYLTVWLGTRPLETDNFKKPQGRRAWELKYKGKTPVLWVYQTKLHGKGLTEAQRIKPIPLICKEQLRCLEIIQSGRFKRPLVKTIVRHCGEGINTYGGRKGFTDLWLARGQSLENISIWLGHRSIERTWKSYKDKETVRWD
jgi:hypothetical protein